MSEDRLPLLDDVIMDGETARERGIVWAEAGRIGNPLLERLMARLEDPEALWPQELHDRLLDLVHDAVHQAVDARQDDINELFRARLYQLVRSLDDES